MKKTTLAVIGALTLAAALAACGGEPADTAQKTEPTEPSVTLSAKAETTEPAPETTETTPAETTASVPLPEVVDGTVYTKQAKDAFNVGENFDFVHTLTIPKIDSVKPGAEALNQKILADQQEKLDKLAADGEENLLYTVTYSASGADGILAVKVYEYIGWQYSEGGSSSRFYYYDAAADCELTMDEVLDRLSMTLEDLNHALAWSNEYASISIEEEGRTWPRAVRVFGDPVTDTDDHTAFYYVQTQNGAEVELLGLTFDETTVSPCYRYAIYTVGTMTCPIDRTSRQPLHPYYDCVLDAADLQTGDAFRITVRDGKVAEAIVPADAQVQRITITSDGVTVLYGKAAPFALDRTDFCVNGKSINSGFNSGITGTEGVFSTYRSMSAYIPLNALETVEFIAKTNLN